MSFEVRRGRVGLQVLCLTKGENHRVGCRFSVDEGTTVTTPRSQDEHIVVDPGSWRTVRDIEELNVGSEVLEPMRGEIVTSGTC